MNAKLQKVFNFKYRRWVNIFIHIASMLMFFLPEVITNIDDNRPMPYGVIIKTLIYIMLFYINYFTINYFLDNKGGRWKFFGMNTALLIATSFIMYFTSHGYTDKNFNTIQKPSINHEMSISFGNTPPPPPPHEIGEPHHHSPHHSDTFTHAMARLSRDILVAILVIALAFAVRMTLRWLNEQNTRAALLASQREIELENLKSQVNPHFLFNTLNTIYVLTTVNPTQAQEAVHKLSGMLRYALYESSQTVTLAQEISFLENYISLMKIRMNNNHPIDISMNCNGHCEYPIAPLLFIPIIENAFKYGNTGDPTKGIKIELLVNDCQVNVNTFNHFDNEKRKSHKDSGIGLSNLQRRLNLIYGNDASLKTIEHNNTFQVELTINLKNYKS